MSVQPEPEPEPERERGGDAEREVPLEDEPAADERDEGWGERSSGYDDDWYLSQRPPHWD